MTELSHFVALEIGRPFVVFNDDGSLTMEPVDGDDLAPIEISPGSPHASAAWSSDCSWYFIIMENGIALLNTYSDNGFYCRKKSARFIELFIEAPRRK